jgi:uncharacterized protein DUF6922
MVPNELRSLFWDTNILDFDPTAHPDYTIFRILEYGDISAIEWLRSMFADREIVRVLKTERRLSPKSATFWALVYRIPADQVATLVEQQSLVESIHE